MGVPMPGQYVTQGYDTQKLVANPQAQPPLRAQLSLIADNLANALDQVTRIEDAINYQPSPTGGGPAPAPSTLQEQIEVLANRTLAVANRLGRIADKL